MRDIHEVLREKEDDCARVRQQIEALRIVAHLLDEQPPPALAGEEQGQPVAVEAGESAQAPAPEDESAENDRKGPISTSQTESSWWRRRQSGS